MTAHSYDLLVCIETINVNWINDYMLDHTWIYLHCMDVSITTFINTVGVQEYPVCGNCIAQTFDDMICASVVLAT